MWRTIKTSCFAEKAAHFFFCAAHFFFCAGRTEMSQALGRFSEVPLGFINYSDIDIFAVQATKSGGNCLIFSSGATKMNTGAIKMLLVQPKCHSRACDARA